MSLQMECTKSDLGNMATIPEEQLAVPPLHMKLETSVFEFFPHPHHLHNLKKITNLEVCNALKVHAEKSCTFQNCTHIFIWTIKAMNIPVTSMDQRDAFPRPTLKFILIVTAFMLTEWFIWAIWAICNLITQKHRFNAYANVTEMV